MPPPGSDPPDPDRPSAADAQPHPAEPARRERGGVTPASRLLFWIKSAFIGDAAIAAFGGVLLAVGREDAAVGVLVFTAVRAALGVVALLLAARALERRNPNDDAPSAVG